jgi:hypothetical protein
MPKNKHNITAVILAGGVIFLDTFAEDKQRIEVQVP